MTNIIIAMDISGSMREDVLGTNKSKFETLKEKLITILTGIEHKLEFSLCFFNDKLVNYGCYNESSEVIKALNTMEVGFTGGTKIWDCLKDIIDNINNKDKTLILCFTDGEDSGSGETLESIISKIKEKEKVELKIIDITGTLAEHIKRKNTDIPEEIVRITDVKQSFDHLETELKKELDRTVRHSRLSIKISVPIIPLIPCDNNEISLVYNGITQAIPYLEEISSLRYYPVTTYIVNEDQMKELLQEKEQDLSSPEELKGDIAEFIFFISCVLLNFHTRYYIPEQQIRRITDYEDNYYKNHIDFSKYFSDNYKKYTDFSDEDRRWLMYNSELVLTVKLLKYANNELNNKDIKHFINPNLTKSELFLKNVQVCLKEIDSILCNILKTGPFKIKNFQYFDRAFKNFDCTSHQTKNCKYPDLDRWKRRLTKEEYNELLTCIDTGNHEWNLDLESILKVYRIAIKVIFKLLHLSRAIEYIPIIKAMRCDGLYIPVRSKSQETFSQIIKNIKPSWFTQSEETGKVIICIDMIKNRLMEISKNKPGIDLNNLLGKILTSIIIHEHSHGITREGVSEKYKYSYQRKNDDEETIVSESLAEWTELNFFRDDEEMTDIIITHASSGNLPEWPYAGALILENSYSKSHLKDYRGLLNKYRSEPDKAYNKLVSINKRNK